MDTAVIGCGIAGLLSAYHALRQGVNIKIFERMEAKRWPRKHCCGLVSPETLGFLPYSTRFVEGVYRGVKVFVGLSRNPITLLSQHAIAYKINRLAHERLLLSKLEDLGATIEFGAEVVSLKHGARDSYVIHIRRGCNGTAAANFDSVILCEGYPPALTRSAGLRACAIGIPALQCEFEIGARSEDDFLYVLIEPALFGLGFSWLVIAEGRALVGTASHVAPLREALELAKRFFGKRLSLSFGKCVDIYGGFILAGFPKRVKRGKIIAIGDSVAMVKSVSGGGLYAISRVAPVIPRLLLFGGSESLRTIMSKLRAQYIIKRILWLFARSTTLRGLLENRAIEISIRTPSLYDDHELAALYVALSVLRGSP